MLILIFSVGHQRETEAASWTIDQPDKWVPWPSHS